MKIAHLADIHVKFSSRHDEYREVFTRLYKDLKSQKPDRITIVGDLNHQKINMSPGSLDLNAELLVNLAKIAPLDIFLGNHDMNLSQKEQGDTISPMLKIIEKFSELLSPMLKAKMNKSYIVSKENVGDIDFSNKGIYFFPDTDFYKINEKLVYGVYSCKDNKLLTLKKKEKDVNYIGFYHGRIYGARGDNGYELFGDDLVNPATFNNFDVVMLGDIHEHQSFREDDSMAYCGSLIQQNNGESINKGYLIWDIEKKTFQRRYILNDFGFAKITIAKGESVEERVDNIQFSNNKKKTKIYVIWEDYEENYSTEKESQIARLIKEKHGCEVVTVSFSALEKAVAENTDVADAKNKETFIEQLVEYVEDIENDFDDDLKEELVTFAKKTDEILEIGEVVTEVKNWDIEDVEISNIFSFDEKPVKIPFNKFRGLTGIFGRNYSGKSNTVKAIVWGLYQYILDDGDAKKIINIYTTSNKGYVKINLVIEGERYRIYRQVITTLKKDGTTSNNYPVSFEKLTFNEDGKEMWVSKISDKRANENTEVKNLIIAAIGSVDDFTKVSLESQGGDGSYINLKQQPKNDLINRYVGLEFFRDRYDYGNDFLKDVKKTQKTLGNIVEVEGEVIQIKVQINTLKKEIQKIEKEKTDAETLKDKIDANILETTKKLKPILEYEGGDVLTIEEIKTKTSKINQEIEFSNNQKSELLVWLFGNFKKELSLDPNLTFEGLTQNFNEEDELFQTEKDKYVKVEKWIKENLAQELVNVEGYDAKIKEMDLEVGQLQAKLLTYKGEQCPTCGHITQQPDPQKYQLCLIEISEKQGISNSYSQAITQNTNAATYNNNITIQQGNLAVLKNSLIIRKNNKDEIKKTIDLFIKSESIIEHNKNVETKTSELDIVKSQIVTKEKEIDKISLNADKIKNNKKAQNYNSNLNDKLEGFQEQSKGYKFSIYNFNQQLVEKNGDLRIEKNNLENFENKYKEIAKEERKFKIYSLYLQAVHRDGIPARIIRKKLPVVNNKINSILNSIVDFQIQLKVLPNGDVVEEFYFNEDRSDALPLSSASGSQKFISSLVIKDALHYISNLIKPSINIIDEGFGTLDDELTSGIVNVLYYLKNKYKNVVVITHRNEIKDFMDNIIEAYKDTSSISQEILDKNPKAGVTKLNVV